MEGQGNDQGGEWKKMSVFHNTQHIISSLFDMLGVSISVYPSISVSGSSLPPSMSSMPLQFSHPSISVSQLLLSIHDLQEGKMREKFLRSLPYTHSSFHAVFSLSLLIFCPFFTLPLFHFHPSSNFPHKHALRLLCFFVLLYTHFWFQFIVTSFLYHILFNTLSLHTFPFHSILKLASLVSLTFLSHIFNTLSLLFSIPKVLSTLTIASSVSLSSPLFLFHIFNTLSLLFFHSKGLLYTSICFLSQSYFHLFYFFTSLILFHSYLLFQRSSPAIHFLPQFYFHAHILDQFIAIHPFFMSKLPQDIAFPTWAFHYTHTCCFFTSIVE